MKKMISAVIGFVGLTAFGVSAAQQYNLTEIGFGNSSIAWGVNNAGQVIGWASVGDINSGFQQKAFVWENGVTTNLFPETGSSAAYGINDNGTIIGTLSNASTNWQTQTFIYSGGAVTTTDAYQGAPSGINNNGVIVGHGYINGWTAYVQNPGQSAAPISVTQDLGMTGSGQVSYARSINDAGQIVGVAWDSEHPDRAFIYQNGATTNLGVLSGDTFSQAMDINQQGAVVGYSGMNPCGNGAACNSVIHGFIYQNGTMTGLGSFGGADIMYANQLNATNQVVGTAYIGGAIGGFSPGQAVAFSWVNGELTNLNDVAGVSGTGWYLQQAFGVNDSGQIVGVGYFNGQQRGYLLTPLAAVPEPEAYAMMLAGLAVFGVASRRTNKA